MTTTEPVAICPNPIFVIGSPRSGTSILPWSLAQHPTLWTSRETDFLYELFGRDRASRAYDAASSRPGTWIQEHQVDRREFLAFVGAGLNALLTSRSGGKRWIDQTPLYTLMVDELACLFPGAQFLHIVRDGRRVVHSMVHFGEALGRNLQATGHLPDWATGFDEASRTWRRFVEAAAAFCTDNPARCLTIRNEELASDPDAGFQRILSFVGASFDRAPADFFRSSRINSSFESNRWVVSRDLEPTHPETGRREEAWHGWTADERRVFVEEAGELLITLGYATASELAMENGAP